MGVSVAQQATILNSTNTSQGQWVDLQFTDNWSMGFVGFGTGDTCQVWVSDLPTNPGLSVTGATNASPIVITTPGTSTGISNGNIVTVSGVVGNTAANGTWTVANLATGGGNTTFQLATSTGNGAFSLSAPTGYVAIPQVTDDGSFTYGAPVTSDSYFSNAAGVARFRWMRVVKTQGGSPAATKVYFFGQRNY
jgi:hypothetical protein